MQFVRKKFFVSVVKVKKLKKKKKKKRSETFQGNCKQLATTKAY